MEDINIPASSSMFNTQIPSLGDDADIQKALIAYHYGDPDFDRTSGAEPGDILPQSIAGYLKDLYAKFDTVSGQADIPVSTFLAARDILGNFGLVSGSFKPSVISFPTISEATPIESHYGKVLTITSYNPSSSAGKVPNIEWQDLPVTLTNTATLTNKTFTLPKINDTSSNNTYTFAVSELTADRTITLPLLTANDTFVFAAHLQTLTNKTLTAPRITSASHIADSNGNELIKFPSAVTSAVNEITVSNSATGSAPTITASGGDTNISLNLVSKGTGTIQSNGLTVATLTGAETLTNKTLTTPSITNPSMTSINSGGFTLTLPQAADTLVGRATTDELTNKTLTSPIIKTGMSFSAGVVLTLPTDSAVSSTPASNDNSTKIATTAFVNSFVGASSSLVRRSDYGVGQILLGTVTAGSPSFVTPGLSGYVLTSNGQTQQPSWQALPASSGGTVTSVATQSPVGTLSSGTIVAGGSFTTSGTIGLSGSAGHTTTGTWTFGGLSVTGTGSSSISTAGGISATGAGSFGSISTAGNVTLSGASASLSLTAGGTLNLGTNGKIGAAGSTNITSTEMSYLTGLTSNVQTQINTVSTYARPLWQRRTTAASQIGQGSSVNIFTNAANLTANIWYYYKIVVVGTGTYSSGTMYANLQHTFSSTPQNFYGTVYSTGGGAAAWSSRLADASSAPYTLQATGSFTSGSFATTSVFEGYFRTNAVTGGTLLPQMTLTGGGVATFIVQPGTYIQLQPLPNGNENVYWV